MSKPYILIIDDSKDYLALLAEGLDDNFNVRCASDLFTAEAFLKENLKFDIALVDENIGDEKGSKWIKKQNEKMHHLITSFVLYSGLATEEAILAGLACGADDFLSKPMSLLALNSKLEKLVEYHEKIKIFENELKSKDNVINISMAQASKYGSCMQLTSKLNQCFTIEQIKDSVFSYLYAMSLHGCIAFYPYNESASFFSAQKGYCSPVEIEVMELLKVKPRLYRFGPRTIFNHTYVSILILNLEDGTIDTDIYIDALASVIECIGARLEFIAYKNSLVNVQLQIQQAVSTTKKMVEISKIHQQEVMSDIVQNIGTSFHVLDMTMVQEEYLMTLVHNALKKNSQDDVNFLEISQLLDAALQSVEQLKALNNGQTNIFEIEEEDELF